MDIRKNPFKTIDSFNDYLFEHSLWKRYEGRELTEEQAEFITTCMTENLEHARHVENERLTFNSIFLALVAGSMALAGTLNPVMTFGMYLFLTIAGFLSIVLTARWNNAFSRHMFYAQRCYVLLHINLFGNVGDLPDDRSGAAADNPEAISDLKEMPMYCFRPHRPFSKARLENIFFRPRTRHLYTAFYWVVQIMLIACTIMSLTEIF